MSERETTHEDGQSMANYLRFVVLNRDADSRSRTGVLVAADELRDDGNLEAYEDAALGAALSWFNEHLRVPALLERDSNERALSWFKAEATRPIEMMWEVVGLLRSHGVHVELIKTDEPGIVIYEDPWQVVAKPSRAVRAAGGW